MEQRYRNGKKNGRKILSIWIVFSVICFFVSSVSAKYQSSYQAELRVVTSDSFYFSVDLTGDSKMENGRFSEKEEKTYHLYGGSRHTVSMSLRNYYDSLRVTQTKIQYQVNLEASAGLASVKMADQDGLLHTFQGENAEAEPLIQGTLGRDDEGSVCGPEERELILELEPYSNQNYQDGEEVKLVIESTAPYKKTIELHFILHREEQNLSYEIQDSPGNVYAELIMKNRVPNEGWGDDSVRPYIIWPKELSIDQTNPLTYQWDAEHQEFVQQSIEDQDAIRKMQISRTLKMNESCSVYFFKSDVTQDYTKETTILHPDSDGNWEIFIPKANAGTELSYVNSLPSENAEMALPEQTAAVSYGRQYLETAREELVNPAAITNESACTLQFTTQYMPGKYDQMREILQTSFHELYLWDGEDIAVTATKSDFVDEGEVKLQSIIKGSVPQSIEGYTIVQESAEDGNLAYYLETPQNEKKKIELQSEVSGEFTLPPGTMITLIARIQDYAPSYWYYYCTEEKGEISLSDFRQMNAASERSTYSLSAASGNQVDVQAEESVKEDLHFIIDFGNIAGETADGQVKEACAKLGHIATVNGVKNVEIMYPSYPKVSDTCIISGNDTDSPSIDVRMTDADRVYSGGDTYELQIEIAEKSELEDTRCREREYAVKLEQLEVDENGNPKTDAEGNVITRPFPEGMTVMYGEQQLTANEDHRVFIVPVKEAGIHNVTLSPGISAFCGGKDGQVILRASLYAARDASYYNDVDLRKSEDVSFFVQAESEYTLGVGAAHVTGEENQRHLFEKGETFSLGVCAFEEGMPRNEDEVSVAVYQFDKKNQSYTCIDWQDVFVNEDSNLVKLSDGAGVWEVSVSEEAVSGVYRLEFSYHDKTEYVDFIVN